MITKQKAVLKYLGIAVAALPVLYLTGSSVVSLIGAQIKIVKLQDIADQKLVTLQEVLALDVPLKNSQAIVDGDILTASPDPAQSTTAKLSYNNSATLSQTERKVFKQIAQSNFKRDGGDVSPYYLAASPAYTGSPLTNVNQLTLRYVNGTDALLIRYQFDKYYTCPQPYVCGRSEKTAETTNSYDISGFADIPVTEINVTYGDKNNNLTRLPH